MRSRESLEFAGLTVIVTGAGAGLGRHYALDAAAAGARVVVNARHAAAADAVVEQITRAGGVAAPAVVDARDGAAIVDAALLAFGRVDALIVNAGIVRDRTFARMSDEEWNEVIATNLGGARAVARAVWPHMLEQQSGRIVFTTSGAGLHGNVGQANYAAAKAGVIGLAKSLAHEGRRYGVAVNAVAPVALTGMTEDVFDEAQRQGLSAAAVTPFVLALAHPSSSRTGRVVEVGGGWAAEVRWQRSRGVRTSGALSATDVIARWGELADFTAGADHPEYVAESLSAALDGTRTADRPPITP